MGNWIFKIIASKQHADRVGIQHAGENLKPIGRKQAAKILFQYACEGKYVIYTERFGSDVEVVGIFVYEKE